jgi:hypothetical protein
LNPELLNALNLLNPFGYGHKKTVLFFKNGSLNKYGSYLLSRIVVQYHRPWGA